jgi:hypothetical protein
MFDKDSSPSERCSTSSDEAAPSVTSLAVIFTLAIPARAHNTRETHLKKILQMMQAMRRSPNSQTTLPNY